MELQKAQDALARVPSEAQQLAARSEALFVDHTYTAKAFAGLVAKLRAGELREAQTVLFWHTGGQVGLFV